MNPMKTRDLLFVALLSILLTSCSTKFYQVYKVVPTEKIVLNENQLVYEDDNCKVSYHLWDEGGNIGFIFYNKSEQNIYLNMEESFFIENGLAHNYYQNRVYTSSKTIGATTYIAASTAKSITGLNYYDLLQTNRISSMSAIGGTTSSGYAVSYNEEKITCIPSKTAKIITEYSINETILRDCDLLKYPTKSQITTKSFTKSDSPMVFSNRITYMLGLSVNQIVFENEFYISEITNLPESEMIESGYDEYCGQKGVSLKYYYKNVSPDKFFIKYTKLDSWKH